MRYPYLSMPCLRSWCPHHAIDWFYYWLSSPLGYGQRNSVNRLIGLIEAVLRWLNTWISTYHIHQWSSFCTARFLWMLEAIHSGCNAFLIWRNYNQLPLVILGLRHKLKYFEIHSYGISQWKQMYQLPLAPSQKSWKICKTSGKLMPCSAPGNSLY